MGVTFSSLNCTFEDRGHGIQQFKRSGAGRNAKIYQLDRAEAVRVIYTATHNCAEGAGAAALAALLKERERLHGPAAVILSGQNIDRTWMQTVLAGGTPCVS